MTPFIVFEELSITNGRTFKKLTLPLHDQGLVLILGKNGSGKSTIWALLEAVFYGSTPSGHKRDELTKNKKDCELKVSLKLGDEQWVIAYKREKGKWQHVLETNGQHRDYHTVLEASKATQTALGLTKAEFEGSVHLTQSSQHILIEGKPTERKNYISNFFGIDERYDQVEQAAKAEVAKVEAELEKLSGYSHTLRVLNEDMKNLQYTDTAPLEGELANLTTESQNLREEGVSLRNIESTWKLYNELYPTANFYQNPENLKQKLESQKISLMSQINSAREIKLHNQKAIVTNRTIDDLEKKKSELFQEEFMNTDLDSETQTLAAKKANYLALQPMLKELNTIPSNLVAIDTEIIEKELNQIRTNVLTNEQKVVAIKAGKCPTCKTDFKNVDYKALEQEIDVQKQMITELATELQKANSNNQMFKRRMDLEQATRGCTIFTSEDNERLARLTSLTPLKNEYNKVCSQLTHLSKVDLLEEIEADTARAMLTEIEQDLTKVNECLIAVGRLPEKPLVTELQVSERLSEISEKLTSIQKKQSEIHTEIGRISAENGRYLKVQEQINQVEKKVENIPQLEKDLFFWKKLVEAYGPKGIRVQQLKKIMDVVLQRLPFYTNILFEDKTLSFVHSCDSNNIEIMARRQEGDSHYEHDISSMSGGERRALSVAFVLTLADCISQRKRSNILILDEVDTNLDQEAQFRFVNHLLPILKNQYSSIFLISHAEEVQQAAIYDQIWNVKKENHYSTVERKAGE
jgi:DNA repair protein SbcC/Rad50